MKKFILLILIFSFLKNHCSDADYACKVFSITNNTQKIIKVVILSRRNVYGLEEPIIFKKKQFFCLGQYTINPEKTGIPTCSKVNLEVFKNFAHYVVFYEISKSIDDNFVEIELTTNTECSIEVLYSKNFFDPNIDIILNDKFSYVYDGNNGIKHKYDINSKKFIDFKKIFCFQCRKFEYEDENLKLFECGKCRLATYCSEECQNAHWKTHKPQCTDYKLMKEQIKRDVNEKQKEKREKIEQLCSSGCSASETDVKFLVCARCKKAKYCSRECQKAHWKTHKQTCGKTEENSTAAAAYSTSDAGDSKSSSDEGPTIEEVD